FRRGRTLVAPCFGHVHGPRPHRHSFPTRRSSDLFLNLIVFRGVDRVRSYAVNSGDSISSVPLPVLDAETADVLVAYGFHWGETRSEEHTSELQSRETLVCRLLLEKKNRPEERSSW